MVLVQPVMKSSYIENGARNRKKRRHTLLRFAFRFAQTTPKEKSENVPLRT